MSCEIREYESMYLGDNHNDTMSLTSFMGGEKDSCIQIKNGNKYCALTEKQLIDLKQTIQNRLDLIEGYTKTGEEMEEIYIKAD